MASCPPPRPSRPTKWPPDPPRWRPAPSLPPPPCDAHAQSCARRAGERERMRRAAPDERERMRRAAPDERRRMRREAPLGWGCGGACAVRHPTGGRMRRAAPEGWVSGGACAERHPMSRGACAERRAAPSACAERRWRGRRMRRASAPWSAPAQSGAAPPRACALRPPRMRSEGGAAAINGHHWGTAPLRPLLTRERGRGEGGRGPGSPRR